MLSESPSEWMDTISYTLSRSRTRRPAWAESRRDCVAGPLHREPGQRAAHHATA
jgi:hypothetical protein